jgi:heme oxygenase
MGSAGPGSWASGCADQSTGGAAALTRPAADLSRGERCGAVHPDPPWEELTPRARSAVEALNRDTKADITMRGEPMRSEHPLQE